MVASNRELQELNAQIAELERIIRARKAQMESWSSSAVVATPATARPAIPADAEPGQAMPVQQALAAEGSTAGTSGVIQVGVPAAVQSKVATPIVAVKPVTRTGGLLDRFGGNLYLPVAGLVAMAFVIFGVIRIRGRSKGTKQSEPVQAAPSLQENAIRTHIINPQSTRPGTAMKVPAQTAEAKPQAILPPEYEMLEEADIYLRFGHDKLAEDALREAIKINPRNPQAYLILLRIYSSREDAAKFTEVAKQLKPIGDESVWARVVEMGRSLDPDNPFYV